MGQELLLFMVPPQPSVGSEVKCKSHGSIPRFSLSKINLFSGILSNLYIDFFVEVMNLMNYCAVIGFHSNCGI